MAIKKSQIYSTLWSACDELRGSMDASQYKDYVLMMLFVKYLSDKENDSNKTHFKIPEGCRFSDFVALKGNLDIGEKINIKLESIKSDNLKLLGKLTLPNFNDPAKFGNAAEKSRTLTRLVGVFENSDLDFSKNRSADDDILGDAYEYLMKNFAVQSGKSKGQFYTPAEVSRIMAKLLHLNEFKSKSTTIYDPTCGSGSLLLRAVDETAIGATPFGQEKDNATASLAILNMLLHGKEMAKIEQGDTLLSPKFRVGDRLMTFDVCVANPPFSVKSWMGDKGSYDEYNRWNDNLCPPEKCGDYAFLLHLIASMKPETGRGACILPHGVLFRGNAEYDIRKNIVSKGYIEGIIGLPANIFFGTGIPASIIIINKAGASTRRGIFFIDAKDGYMKEGAKNRLREQDVKLIVDTWNAREDVPHYARFVSYEEISNKENNFNLNIPRYITPVDTEIRQDIEAHLHGGLPQHDIDNMDKYFSTCNTLKQTLFAPLSDRAGYYSLTVPKDSVAEAVEGDDSYIEQLCHFEESVLEWSAWARERMLALDRDIKPKKLIEEWSQHLLNVMFADRSLVNAYDAYQKLMEYWADTLQDDCYMISRDAWKITLTGSKKNATYKDLICDLLPVSVVVKEFFAMEEKNIEELQMKSEEKASRMKEMIETAVEDIPDDEEQEIKDAISKVKKSKEYKTLDKEKKEIDGKLKTAVTALTEAIRAKYAKFTDAEVRDLVVNKKWLDTISENIRSIMNSVRQQLVSDVVALADRYEATLPELSASVTDLESKVSAHLKEMGFEL